MLWHAMPPELNTARLIAGAGPAPMLQGAGGWQALGDALETQAGELAAILVNLKESWSGTSSERAIAATTPMVAWLQSAAKQAQQRALQATAQAASYTTAVATIPSLPEIAANHITHAVLTATNFLGINLMPIGLNEVDYFVRMWNQAAGAMDIYQAETAANTVFEPVAPMKPILQAEVGDTVTSAVSGLSEMASQSAPGALLGLTEAAEEVPVSTPELQVPLQQLAMQLLTQMGQFGAPMQQLMQPLQQMTSLAGNIGSTGGPPADNLAGDKRGELVGDKRGEPEAAQLGLLGASPLSNHPLAGGSGPSAGLGLMRAESLPGSGGTASRTPLIKHMIDKPTQGVAPATAGSSAVPGGAPLGMTGAGAPSGTGSRPGLAMPVLVADHRDDDVRDEPNDDW